MIGNALIRSIGNTFSLSVRRRVTRTHPRAERPSPTPRSFMSFELASIVDCAKEDGAEMHAPLTTVDFLKAQGLAGKHFSDEQPFAPPFDLAVRPSHADFPIVGIYDFRQSGWIWARGRSIDLVRRDIS